MSTSLIFSVISETIQLKIMVWINQQESWNSNVFPKLHIFCKFPSSALKTFLLHYSDISSFCIIYLYYIMMGEPSKRIGRLCSFESIARLMFLCSTMDWFWKIYMKLDATKHLNFLPYHKHLCSTKHLIEAYMYYLNLSVHCNWKPIFSKKVSTWQHLNQLHALF